MTPTVYRHLLLEHHKTKKSPLFLGPVLVHYRKEFRNYNFFLSTLVGSHRVLDHILAVGTDGESALVDAVKHQFHGVRMFIAFDTYRTTTLSDTCRRITSQ